MTRSSYRRLTGLLLLVGALAINIPYSILIATFDYPDILRAPAGEILSAYHAGGTGLLLTWFVFAWTGLPLLLAITMLPRALDDEQASILSIATPLGVAAMVVQLVGLLRWVFVVPVLARIVADPASDGAARAAAEVTFVAIHQYGGVVLGEHLGYAFTCLWMAMVSVALIRSARFPSWLGVLGLVAAAVYSLAHGELFATVIPGAPYWAEAGLVGSLLWLLWMAALGVTLLRPASQAQRRSALQGHEAASA